MKYHLLPSLIALLLIQSFAHHIFAQPNRCVANTFQHWWDVQHYFLDLDFNIEDTTIAGSLTVTATVIAPANDTIQLDLHPNFSVTEVTDVQQLPYQRLAFVRRGYQLLIIKQHHLKSQNKELKIKVAYHGKIPQAQQPPWSGGLTVSASNGDLPFWGVTCQMDGSSTFFPSKDLLSDEPDQGVLLQYTVPNTVRAEGNGRLIQQTENREKTTTYLYQVLNPINSYNITFYIGDYKTLSSKVSTLHGKLDYSFSFLKENREKAKILFQEIPTLIQIFEYWCGPYPFYEDGYKLVEAPYLGMEHQSAVAYGNEYLPGYLGLDRSGTGVGLWFDFILVHETAHEWFGNNISTVRLCDLWIHEGFATYMESLYIEQRFDRIAADSYRNGKKKNILNKNPIISDCNLCQKGDGDEYDKAAALVHHLRLMLQDDELFRTLLKDMNRVFYHKIIDTDQFTAFLQSYFKRDISKVLQQYLFTASIPKLDVEIQGNNTIKYRWRRCIKGFDMPYFIWINEEMQYLYPTEDWQSLSIKPSDNIRLSEDWLIDF